MPLNIRTGTTFSGGAGANGDPGATPTQPGGSVAGGNGQSGRSGQSAVAETLNRTFTGDPGNDLVLTLHDLRGGLGGSGGRGGNGSAADTDFIQIIGVTSVLNQTTAIGAGNAGRGGNGADGGTARGTFDTLVFNLGGAAVGGQNTVILSVLGVGGDGGAGAPSGFAGGGATAFRNDRQVGTGGNLFTETDLIVGSASGGQAPAGRGGWGGAGIAAFNDLTFRGGPTEITIDGDVTGGNGGRSGSVGLGAPGGTLAPDAPSGWTGGRGGAALAEAENLTIRATGALELNVFLTATGGDGGQGGAGGLATYNQQVTQITLNGEGTRSDATVYGRAGNGGNGGAGGRAEAAMTDARITGSGQDDRIDIRLAADGGTGGLGGRGGEGAADFAEVVNGPPITSTTTVTGTPDGTNGRTGWAGASVVTFAGNNISLGDGRDTLALRLTLADDGPQTLTLAANTLRGGQGFDTFVFGFGRSGSDPDMTVNAGTEVLRIAGVEVGRITEFERFDGGGGNDRFLDGAGAQTYAGQGGTDRYVFFAGQAGADRVNFAANDVVELRGFGPALNSFADVRAAATQVAGGTRIETSANSSVLLVGTQIGTLRADDFIF
jgi:hypothetical protein